MQQKPELFTKISTIFNYHIARGFVERTHDSYETVHLSSYLPWHKFLKESSNTTKVRIVFNCSCKEKLSGKCLNNFLWKRTNFVNDMVAIVMWFRMHGVVFVADIEKAYHRMKITEKYRQFWLPR